MSTEIRRYIQNCDVCGRVKPWRELKTGLLRPLPLPERIWKELSMDFITELPLSRSCTNLLVITNRLSKDLVLIPMEDIEASSVAWVFIERVVAYHWLPDAIVSNRGSQFVGDFWKKLCHLLRINQRVSMAFHRKTNRSTERMCKGLSKALISPWSNNLVSSMPKGLSTEGTSTVTTLQ